jgi:hypothetical protein
LSFCEGFLLYLFISIIHLQQPLQHQTAGLSFIKIIERTKCTMMWRHFNSLLYTLSSTWFKNKNLKLFSCDCNCFIFP